MAESDASVRLYNPPSPDFLKVREYKPVHADDLFQISGRDWTYIEPMLSSDDFTRALLDVRAKWADALNLNTASDIDHINRVFSSAVESINTARSTFDAANKAIAEASNCAASCKAAAAAVPPTPRPVVPVPRVDPLEGLSLRREFTQKAEEARNALKFYTETNGEEFEFVEILKFENQLHFPYWASHINFTAKPESGPPKLLFAETYVRCELPHNHPSKYRTKICMVIDPSSQDVIKGCNDIHGSKDLLHPKGVPFWAGLLP